MFGSLVLDASQPQAMFRLQAGLLEWRVSEDGSQRLVSLVLNFPNNWTPHAAASGLCSGLATLSDRSIHPWSNSLAVSGPYFIILTDFQFRTDSGFQFLRLTLVL